jgi:hypothetical protein
MRPYDVELLTCQRYFEWCPLDGHSYMHLAGEQAIFPISFKVEKRAMPTLMGLSGSPGRTLEISNTTAYYGYASLYGFSQHIASAVVGPAYMNGYRVAADARL